MKEKKGPKFWLGVSLILILISCIGASILQSNFGSVRIRDIYLGTDQQQQLHALMFIPKNASAEHKVPVVITSHGWLNSAEVQDAASIELSRRGIMVIAMDAYSHGMSSNVRLKEGLFPQIDIDGMGMVPLVEYVSSGILDYVDTSRIGVMGHSMGGMNSYTTIRHYGRMYKAAVEDAKKPSSDGGSTITTAEQAHANSLNKVYAAFPTGAPPSINNWDETFCNVGILLGSLEELGSMVKGGKPFLFGESPDGVEAINSSLPDDQKISSVELGKYYGNKDNGTLRVIYQPKITHPWIHFSYRATADLIEYWNTVFGLNNVLGKGNQIWNIKEFFNLIGLVGIFLLLVPLAQILFIFPVFSDLKGSEPAKLPALTASSKKLFWGGWVLCGAVSFVTTLLAIPVLKLLFPASVALTPSLFFGAEMTNVIMVWAFMNGVFCLFWFWLTYKKVTSKNGVTAEMIGWKISGKHILKTLGLTISIITIVYAVITFCRWLFMTDFRIWTPALKTFKPDKLVTMIPYLPFYFVFFLANGLLVNGANRIEGMSERKNLFICGLGNILGPTLLWAIQYGTLIVTNNVWLETDWICILVIAFCIPQLFVAAYISRYCFKITGKVWLGAMVNTFIWVMLGIMNTCITGAFF
ncbi:MAG: prolyl oligopeptidase family serine peptidase [Treponema sp.]|jgi:hypothetical protein|nr:prolyl oligopeptidase family serine peptidase [Treponema sp.]